MEGRPTATVAGTQVNRGSATAVGELAAEMGARGVPEVGRSRRPSRSSGAKRPAVVAAGGGAKVGGRKARDATHRASTKGVVRRPSPGTPVPSGARGRGLDVTAQRTLASRREHSKGHGNLPRARGRAAGAAERPSDRGPRDVRKERDPRSAPKGRVPAGQRDRNPASEMRDEARSRLGSAPSGFDRARRAADAVAAGRGSARRARPRPTARRSSAAKRKVLKRSRKTR
jgi:hypothetical protein